MTTKKLASPSELFLDASHFTHVSLKKWQPHTHASIVSAAIYIYILFVVSICNFSLANKRLWSGEMRRGVPAREPRPLRAPQPGSTETSSTVHGRDGDVAQRCVAGCYQEATYSYLAATQYVILVL